MTDIFLSYSSKDRERVRPLRDALVAAGYDVFWDVETPTGQDWDDWIRARLREAKVAVVLWTKSSVASRNVRHEVAIAMKLNRLLPAMLEQIDVDDFPMGLYTTQAAALYDWTGDRSHAGYVALLAAIRARVPVLSPSVPEPSMRADVTEDSRPAISVTSAAAELDEEEARRKQREHERIVGAMRASQEQNALREAKRQRELSERAPPPTALGMPRPEMGEYPKLAEAAKLAHETRPGADYAQMPTLSEEIRDRGKFYWRGGVNAIEDKDSGATIYLVLWNGSHDLWPHVICRATAGDLERVALLMKPISAWPLR